LANSLNINYLNTQITSLSHHIGKKILVAPLDWGLGHATRCIPIIRTLHEWGHTVCIAGEGAQQKLLQNEFPTASFLPLGGYKITYPSYKEKFKSKIALQLAKITASIRRERRWLANLHRIHQFDAVISDNRFGLYHDAIPCIFLTHQLHIMSGMGTWMDRMIQALNYRYINRFTHCWIPDIVGNENLAGELSHPARIPKNSIYIGPLSRLKKANPGLNHDLAIVLSGPEPQRSLLEQEIIKELKNFDGTGVFVRGVPGIDFDMTSIGKVKVFSHLPSDQLSSEIGQAKLVLSRSGYSTVMDLACLQKKAVLIPTPGQTEQEYLAAYLHSKKLFCSLPQEKFSLQMALELARNSPFSIPEFEMSGYKKHLLQFVESL
jgi:uncharacterized protein (TIGR00661 family)